MSKHTPGPWRWQDWPAPHDGTPGDALLGGDGYGVAWCDKPNSPVTTSTANAALIAAAPELAEALQERTDAAGELALLLVNCIHQIQTDYANTGRSVPVCALAADDFLRRMNAGNPHPEDRARAALAKAGIQ